MDLGVSGKSVIVTGGSREMGRIAAEMLAAEGAKVAIVARGKEAVEEAVEAIRNDGGTALAIPADVTKREDVTRAVEETRRAFGSPLIVIGQSKFIVPGDFADIDDSEVYVDPFRTYTLSQLWLLKAVLPDMKAAGWGRFVHIEERHTWAADTFKAPAGRMGRPEEQLEVHVGSSPPAEVRAPRLLVSQVPPSDKEPKTCPPPFV